jgi:CarboxypepD_reg-like domain
MMIKRIWWILFLVGITSLGAELRAQRDSNLVQFSGLVLDGSNDQLIPVPYTNVFIKGKNRGTYSDLKGFFSIVVEKGDVIRFSTVGYETVEYKIPKDLSEDRYSLVQLMTQDVVNLPETVIFPWPSRDHFRLEFLAMDVTPELQKRAAENVAKESLKKAEVGTRFDGDENADFYLRRQASNYYYYGQAPPMNIFNPIAWGKFFKAWKDGDFKKKE